MRESGRSTDQPGSDVRFRQSFEFDSVERDTLDVRATQNIVQKIDEERCEITGINFDALPNPGSRIPNPENNKHPPYRIAKQLFERRRGDPQPHVGGVLKDFEHYTGCGIVSCTAGSSFDSAT